MFLIKNVLVRCIKYSEVIKLIAFTIVIGKVVLVYNFTMIEEMLIRTIRTH